jgi:hypothetical protein
MLITTSCKILIKTYHILPLFIKITRNTVYLIKNVSLKRNKNEVQSLEFINN